MTGYDPEDIPNDVREEMADERRRRARDRHWCPDCLGHTGPGSPCYQEPEPDPQPEDDDDEEANDAP